MTFVDEITLEVSAGKGGDGVVRWNTSRQKSKGGPAGGNGGCGGDVVLRAVRDISLLEKYRGNTTFRAHDGGDGSKNSLHGRDGQDVVIDLPVGSVVRLVEHDTTYELLKAGEEIVILKGGKGGYGNEHFKGSRNVRPTEFTSGKRGGRDTLEVELKLIADAGLVGEPNAGKSSLLNTLTNARAKVGNYEFTTLDPNLGDLYGYIIADIPGIIEGASEGRGLGFKFLRHINRTKTLIFCISVERDDPISAFRALQAELGKHDSALRDKPSMIVLTKTDLVEYHDTVSTKLDVLKAKKGDAHVYPFSVYDDNLIKQFRDALMAFLQP